jgi:hypothetical protein
MRLSRWDLEAQEKGKHLAFWRYWNETAEMDAEEDRDRVQQIKS